MRKKIITISREYGSGGRIIGRMVADKLGISFYDKEFIKLVGEQSGFALDFIEETGEYSSANVLNFAASGLTSLSVYAKDNVPVNVKIHMLQSKLIREIADKGPCVIIGRSADYILKDMDCCLNVFIHADMKHKVERAINEYGVSNKDPEKALAKKDKARANQYGNFTGQIWGVAKNYHITLDSGYLGLQKCVDIITDAATFGS